VTGTGVAAAAEAVTTSDLADLDIAETYEGVLVSLSNLTAQTDPDDFGEWMVEDDVVIDNLFYSVPVAAGGTLDSLTGLLYYSYGAYKVEPRDADDVEGLDCGADTCLEELVQGDLVVTEVMLNPAYCGDSDCEWIEVYNATSGTVNLNGLRIEDTGGSTGHIYDDLVVAAGSYTVLGVGDGTSWGYTDFTPSGFYGSLAWTQGGDMVSLSNSTLTMDSGAEWTEEPVSAGYSWQLDVDALDASSNDTVSNWCASATQIGSSGDYGTPGTVNDVECKET
jgi:hypothetical protein